MTKAELIISEIFMKSNRKNKPEISRRTLQKRFLESGLTKKEFKQALISLRARGYLIQPKKQTWEFIF